MQNLIFGPALFFSAPLFFDIPEYLQIAGSHTFWQSITLGHFPIHPVFMGILWIMIKFFPVNVIAMFFGAISIFIFYKITKPIFNNSSSPVATLIFALFPAVWLINTNLMVESLTLTFYIASTYFFLSGRKRWFAISFFLMIGTHLESIVWAPTIFLFPLVFDIGIRKKDILEFIKLAVLSAVFSVSLYIFLYGVSGKNFGGSTEQLTTYFSSGLLRMIRNAWLSFIRDFGSLTPFVFAMLLVKNVRSKLAWRAWAIFFALVFLIGANWQGDFMGRRIIFASVLLALAIYKYLGRKTIFITIYLLPIVAANIILYSRGSPFIPLDIPKGQVLIQTHYLAPFTKYDGTVIYLGVDDLGKIDGFLKSGERVFLAKEAVTAPYMLLVGNNYHITSLGKVGDSESRFLFKKYIVVPYLDNFELKLFKGKVSKEAGQPVIFYDKSFWGRLARRRIDYGDAGSWLWAVITNHRDPTGWTYKDMRGVWYNM